MEKKRPNKKKFMTYKEKLSKRRRWRQNKNTDEEKPRGQKQRRFKNKNEAEVKNRQKKKQLKGSKKRVAMLAGEARPSRIVKCSVTSESEPEFAESSDEESSPRKRGQQWTAQRLWDDLNFENGRSQKEWKPGQVVPGNACVEYWEFGAGG